MLTITEPAAPWQIAAPIPTTRAERTRWALSDGWIIVRRNLMHLRREPAELVAALIFPAIMVVLFGYVFGSAIKAPGGENYREYLMPGLFVMTGFTGIMTTSQVVASDAAKGVMDRFRSMPLARSAVPFGQAGADILLGLLAMVIMVGCGIAVGWRIHHGLGQAAEAFGLLILMRYAVGWVGIYLGLAIKNEETVDHLTPLIFPVTMISNSFVPTAGMPGWLRVISDWNPISANVAACRDLFGNAGPKPAHLALPIEHPVIATLAWSALLLAICVPASVRRYRKAS
jgi:ABC-2 type transport system permease protein